jgi:hypothetical protein
VRSIFQSHVFSPWSNFSDLPAVEITAEQIADMMRLVHEKDMQEHPISYEAISEQRIRLPNLQRPEQVFLLALKTSKLFITPEVILSQTQAQIRQIKIH